MNIQLKPPPPPMTVDEFFTWDGGGHVGELELVEGVVKAMSPASAVHGIIQLNVGSILRAHLKGTPCTAGAEVPVIPPMGRKINARVPDIAVMCEPISDSKVFDAPVLIVEVLSPSNEDETWDSIQVLAGLSSLKEILVVRPDAVAIEVYGRDVNGDWPRDPVTVTAGGPIHLASIGLELPVVDV